MISYNCCHPTVSSPAAAGADLWRPDEGPEYDGGGRDEVGELLGPRDSTTTRRTPVGGPVTTAVGRLPLVPAAARREDAQGLLVVTDQRRLLFIDAAVVDQSPEWDVVVTANGTLHAGRRSGTVTPPSEWQQQFAGTP